MKAFDIAWSVLKSVESFQNRASEGLVQGAKRPQMGDFALERGGYDRALSAGESISTLAERNAVGDILSEMGIHGAGHGFKNQPGAEFYSPLQRDPTTGFGSSRSREERGLPSPTQQQLEEQASYYNALDPQNDYTMLDHYAKYPTGGVTPLRVQDVMGE